MLKLLSVDDRARLVSSSDPSVSAEGDDVAAWLDEATTDHGADALIIEVRPLNSREFLRLQGEVGRSDSPDIELVIRAAEVGLCAVEADGQRDEGSKELRKWIDRIPPAELSALGAYVINTTLIGDTERPT